MMDLDRLHTTLIAAARQNAPGDSVPYGFEKRVLARLHTRPALDYCGLWARALWRAAAPCVAVMVFAGALSLFAPTASTPPADLSQAFENTLLAAAEQDQPADSTW